MKQYKITSQNIIYDMSDDCYLAPDDPIHELKIASYMGGLGSAYKLAAYRAKLNAPENVEILLTGSEKSAIMREKHIQPGTEEWFKLWFGKNNAN